MTNETFCEVLGEIDERYIKEAGTCHHKPVWPKWGIAAACLCFAVLGVFALRHLGGAPDAAVEQPGRVVLEVNEVESVVLLDMDVQISHYTGLPAEEWELAMEAFEQTAGIRYEEFLKRLPPSYQQTAFYSVDAPTEPKSGAYVPHDYVLELQAENGGEVQIAVCGEEEPLRDYFFACDAPKTSEINGCTATIYGAQDSFMVWFSDDYAHYDVETRGITLEELETLLTCVMGQ